MRAIIVGGGDPPNKTLIERYMVDNYVILAADSGGNILYEYGIAPDYLLGDFDSIDERALKELSNNTDTIRLPREKDYTDTHIALLRAIELGANEIILLGCTGKRIDHFMANLCLLKVALEKGIPVFIVDDINEIFLVNKSTTIKGEKGQVFSLFSYCENTKGLTIKGGKYNLDNYNLDEGNNLTVSNEIRDEVVEIIFDSGCLLIFKIT